MKRSIVTVVLLSLVLLLFSSAVAMADDREEAVKLTKEAVAYYNTNGLEKTLDAMNDPKGQFIKGNLYVIVYGMDGTMLANVLKQSLVGQNVLDVPDKNGKKFRREMVEKAKAGSGWVDYVSEHPKTKLPEEKTTYIEGVGDIFFGCGIYKK
jgi:signal transduction histidine kinase